MFLTTWRARNAEDYRQRVPGGYRQSTAHQGNVAAQSGWEFDSLSALWREVSTGNFTANEGSNDIDTAGRNGVFVLVARDAGAGRIANVSQSSSRGISRIAICRQGQAAAAEGPGRRGMPSFPQRRAAAVAAILCGAMEGRARSSAVRGGRITVRCEHGRCSSKRRCSRRRLPPYVLDAVSANLAILKSPTVLREENGNIWGWEGCFPDAAAATARAHMCGTTPRLFRTFTRNWSGHCASWNWAVRWMSAAT